MPNSGHRILLVISSLAGGGAERVAVLLAQGLLTRGHHVDVVTVFGRDRDFYELPRQVHRVALNLGRDRSSLLRKLTGNAQRVLALRKAIRQANPEIIISFMNRTNVLVLLASARLGIPVVATEHVDPSRDHLPRRWEMLRRITYGRAARLVSVSEGVDAYFTWIPQARRRVISNPIPLAEVNAASGTPLNLPWHRTVIAMGRLSPEKGFDVLLRAFAKIAGRFTDWGVIILGEGPERPQLELLLEQLELRGRVRIAGVLHQPFAAMKQADLFVLPSRHEGFGNALVEAMACGLPVIATDCWTGSPEIVHPGTDGLLVPVDNVSTMAAAMADLMADEPRRKQLGRAAAESAQRFDLKRVMHAWDSLLEGLFPAARQRPELPDKA